MAWRIVKLERMVGHMFTMKDNQFCMKGLKNWQQHMHSIQRSARTFVILPRIVVQQTISKAQRSVVYTQQFGKKNQLRAKRKEMQIPLQSGRFLKQSSK